MAATIERPTTIGKPPRRRLRIAIRPSSFSMKALATADNFGMQGWFRLRAGRLVLLFLLVSAWLCVLTASVRSQTVTGTVSTGAGPYAIAVNPVTNKIYVADVNNSTVTVIDGASNTTATISAEADPYAVAVNPVTNKVYVVNHFSNDVTVIDGASNTTATVSVGTNPDAIAVNPVSNKVYVTNNGSNDITVIDGASNATVTVSVGTESRCHSRQSREQ